MSRTQPNEMLTADLSTPSADNLNHQPSYFQLTLVAVLLTVGLRLYLIFSTHATEEDLYITLRYAQNIAHGLGFVYNPSEHVLGATTPLYTLLLALLIRLHIDPILGGKMTAVAADALSCLTICRIGTRFGRPRAGLAAALCFAVAPTNLIESVKGMEVSLVACAVILTWSFWVDGSAGAAGREPTRQVKRRAELCCWSAAAILTLLRIDGILLVPILLLAYLQRDRTYPRAGLAFFAGLTLPWAVFATFYFGSPIPSSLRAKLVVYGWHSKSAFPNLLPFLQLMTHNPLSAVLFAGAILCCVQTVADIVRLRQLPGGARDIGSITLPLVVWLLVYYAGMAFSKVFLFGWYFLPPTPVYYLCACLGLSRAAQSIVRNRRAVAPAWLLAAAVPLACLFTPRAAATLRESQRVEEELRIPIGIYLRSAGRSDERVMLEPIGYIGYYSGLRVLDTVGLVSPEALEFYRKDEGSPYHRMWRRHAPDWILLRAGEWSELAAFEQSVPAGRRLKDLYRIQRVWQTPGSRPGDAPAFLLFRRMREDGE